MQLQKLHNQLNCPVAVLAEFSVLSLDRDGKAYWPPVDMRCYRTQMKRERSVRLFLSSTVSLLCSNYHTR